MTAGPNAGFASADGRERRSWPRCSHRRAKAWWRTTFGTVGAWQIAAILLARSRRPARRRSTGLWAGPEGRLSSGSNPIPQARVRSTWGIRGPLQREKARTALDQYITCGEPDTGLRAITKDADGRKLLAVKWFRRTSRPGRGIRLQMARLVPATFGACLVACEEAGPWGL